MTHENSLSARLLPLLATVMTGFLMVGWFFCAGTGSLSAEWLGVTAKVWFALALGLHLATLSASAIVAFFNQEASSPTADIAAKALVAMVISSLLVSGILLVALIRFESVSVDPDVDAAGVGNSTGYHINSSPDSSRFLLPKVQGRSAF